MMSVHAMQAQRILIVDDEPTILEVLREYLEAESFTVATAADGEQASQQMYDFAPDLIILDLHLPKVSGSEVLRQVRTRSNVPIIILTSRTNETDRIVGLEIGADDYIGKPFSPREVVARVRSVLRRTHAVPSSGGAQPLPEQQKIGRLSIDRAAHEVLVEGAIASLTPTEFRLLDLLAQNLGRVFSREQLLERAATHGNEIFDRTLDRHIANLRRKIEPNVNRPSYIVTVIGTGYKMVEPRCEL